MKVDKEKLSDRFKNGDMEYVFLEAIKITDFVISHIFNIYDQDLKSDIQQECLENFWKKIIANKVNPNGNIFSFIWTNSRLKILEILRKENRRDRIVKFIPYDTVDNDYSYMYDIAAGVEDRYAAFLTME